jgi:putative chitinase
MNKEQFMAAAGISEALTERWYLHVSMAMNEFSIDTPRQRAHFIAQTGYESGGFLTLSENFNYSTEGLKVFGSRLSNQQREKLGRKPGQGSLTHEEQAAIANLVYSGRFGNNNIGDGWKFRGRGLKQITFFENYEACGKALNLPLIIEPDLLLQDSYAARSAGWYWASRYCNRYADTGDIAGLTRIINGGSNGLQERIIKTKMALNVLSK